MRPSDSIGHTDVSPRETPGSIGPRGDMPPEEFREWGGATVEWIARYLEEVGELPVMSRVAPGDIRAALPTHPPESGEAFSDILDDFERVIVPGITHWNHPSFHGYFAVTGSGPGILGEMLAAALNVNGMVWRSSPAATELEEHVLDWVRQLLGLPEGFVGAIQDTASTSSLVALAAARHRAYPEAREKGLFALSRGCIYASEEAHSSIEKAGIVLGLGRDAVRKIEVDSEFRMRPEVLRRAVLSDRAQGIRPVAVVATVGTTSTASADPVSEIADVADELGLWLHVDAAYAGAAAMVPELRPAFRGWERAASIVMNPHKWLFTPVDCSVLLTRFPDEMKGSVALTPEYLRTRETGVATNLMDYGVALGRRFRALKLWFVLRYFGADGIRERIRYHVALAQGLSERMRAEAGWQVMAPVLFSTVAFRFAPAGVAPEDQDALNLELLESVNASGTAFLSHTRLRGRVALRLSIGNLRTREHHIERTWAFLNDFAAAERGVAGPPSSRRPAPPR
ncbi:MAG: amino acid decarboxylase [Gemmatimonadetes bacterium]|nr:amino acid decarboxylase [Gemmatimonadota bacterium]